MPTGRCAGCGHRKKLYGDRCVDCLRGAHGDVARRRSGGSIEDDTALVPSIVADTVIHEVQRYTGDELPDRRTLAARLSEHAAAAYKGNKGFHSKMRGSLSREWLYSFMRHWLAAELKRSAPATFRKLPSGFAQGYSLNLFDVPAAGLHGKGEPSASRASKHGDVSRVGGHSEMYAAVDKSGHVRAKGSSAAMRTLVRSHAGWKVWNSPSSKVGDKLSNEPVRGTPLGVEFSSSGIEKFAAKLSRLVDGSTPKAIPGGYRWSDKNESAQFTTYSPEEGVKVVCVVSVFEDGTMAVAFFSDEHLSEMNRFESITHFSYANDVKELPEMAKDIRWVWKTVDGYKRSWEE